MADRNEFLGAEPTKLRELREESLKLRTNAVRAQIDAVETFCSVVETELQEREIEEARKGVAKIQHAMASIDRHLHEPGHLLPEAVGELSGKFRRLTAQVRGIEGALERKADFR